MQLKLSQSVLYKCDLISIFISLHCRLANTIELELKMFPHERKLQQIQQQRLMVEQFRREASINRISVSQVGGGGQG